MRGRGIEYDKAMKPCSGVAQEIERKFLVANDGWRAGADQGRRLRQAYLAVTERAAIRVRIEDDIDAVLTVKSANPGLTRVEFEYPLPLRDAETLATLREGAVLQKTRFVVPHGGRDWEVDVYAGDNHGLVIAEIETETETADVELPPWVGEEVTGEARYYAARLAMQPYRSWAPASAKH
jgi:adenylate cyclase